MRNKLIMMVIPFVGLFSGVTFAAEKGDPFSGLIPMPLVVDSVNGNATRLVAGNIPFVLPEDAPVQSPSGDKLPHSSLRKGQRVIVYISSDTLENFMSPATALGIQVVGRGVKDE